MHSQNICTPNQRCRYYRTCDACARLRQAHVADLAERLLSQYPAVFLSRFTPYTNTKQEIERLKASIKRQLGNYNAIWSIELGQEKKLLHLNILSASPSFKQPKNTEYWQGQSAQNIRQLAAYMVKKDQIPPIEVYQGRQFGGLTSMSMLLQDKKQEPIIQAAYHEKITLMGMVLPEPYIARQKAIEKMRAESKDYKSIADSHLMKLRAFVAANKGTVK